ncbi:MAG: vWA domain-containing protein [Bacteroidota bacterium]|nr:VWA domain-containing protein [Flammeovirgaceae bacterium]MCZ8069942.1 VWA domain-containing protein [Cytophagales bacterium]
MLFFRSFSWFEAVVILLFVVLYGAYIVRLWRISRVLKTPFYTVLVKIALRSALFALLIIAYLGPSFGSSKREIKSIGKDIMICVDLSKSMDAFDIQPTRLEKIKYEMKKIVAAFSSDRVGVIIFSSEAFMQCPLTYDQNALNLFIETMNTSLVPSSGTDFGPPLKMALKKINDENGASGQQKSKVIILISDGEDFGEETDDVAREVEDNDIKLFTLGVGTEKGGQIQTGRGYKTDNSGNVVISKLNPVSLKALASKTNGQYFEINDSRNDVNRLISTIGKIEGELRDARTVDVSANRYFYFLLAAVLLLVLDLLVSLKTVSI